MTPLIFFGSDRYSAIVLTELLLPENWSTGTPEYLIVTDKSSDKTPVEKLAIAHNLKVFYYPTNPDEMIKFNGLMIKWFNGVIPRGLCASFDHLIPAEIVEKFGGKLYNLHPSLLPQYRNVSPVQYSIAMGDKETGITLFRISAGIDNGEIVSQVAEPILPEDTTPILTSRLFSLGAQLFIDSLITPSGPGLEGRTLGPSRPGPMGTLIFTRRLTRDSGFIEWSALHKLLLNQPISSSDTTNELLRLRLGSDHHSDPEGTHILADLIRALTPWPGVWSTIPTKKGDLRISLLFSDTLDIQHSLFSVLISGKPKPISHLDFEKYYLR